MGQILHRGARTTEAVRRAIQNSQESLRALSKVTGRSGPLGWVAGRRQLFSRIDFLMDLQQLPQVIDAGVGECHEAVVVEAVDVDETVLGVHFDGNLVQPILVLAEHCGDAGEGEDVGDGGHAQAARAASGRAGVQFQGSRSSSRLTGWSLIRARMSAR